MKISKSDFKDGEEIDCGIIDRYALNAARLGLRRIGEGCEVYRYVFWYKKEDVLLRGSVEECVDKVNNMTCMDDEVVE